MSIVFYVKPLTYKIHIGKLYGYNFIRHLQVLKDFRSIWFKIIAYKEDELESLLTR